VGAPFSASSLARARACPASTALPHVEGESSPDAARGTAVHAFLEGIEKGEARADPLAGMSEGEAKTLCEKIDVRLVPMGGQTELAMAFDVVTGACRRLYPLGHRRYDTRPNEVPGTTDVVRFDPTRVVVRDWKTVRWDFDVATARPQLEFYGLCAARIAGVEAVDVEIGIITDDGVIGFERWSLDWEDLARISAEVRRSWDKAGAARAARVAHEAESLAPWTPDVKEGGHCRYCPAILACPAKRAALAMALHLDVATITPDDAGQMLAVAGEASKAADRIREAVKALHAHYGSLPGVRANKLGHLRVA